MKLKLFNVGLTGTLLLALGGLALCDRVSVGVDSIPASESLALERLPLLPQRFYSQAMGTTRQYGVMLPPGYDAHPDQRYPVIILLHGGHDDMRAYADQYGIAQVLQQLYATHRLPPSIVVMPDGNDSRGSSYLWDPQYYNGPNGNLDTLIGVELVQQVKAHYRTLSGPQFWAMGGVSSGGWGAVNIGLKHFDTFGTLFSHSGYFTDSSGAQNSPEQFIKAISPQSYRHLHVYLDTGDNWADAGMRASSGAFHQTLNHLGISNTIHTFPGGHGMSGADVGWNYFHQHLEDSLTYVGQQFAQAE